MSSTEHQSKADDLSVRCAVVTCSDTRTPETDTSGAHIQSVLEAEGHHVAAYEIVQDEQAQIRRLLREYADKNLDVVILSGGTGISKRDATYDVIVEMLEKTMPGFGEIFRVLSYKEIGPASMLSRAIAGVYGGMLVFSIPGSTGAVRLAMDKLIAPDLKHLIWEIRR